TRATVAPVAGRRPGFLLVDREVAVALAPFQLAARFMSTRFSRRPRPCSAGACSPLATVDWSHASRRVRIGGPATGRDPRMYVAGEREFADPAYVVPPASVLIFAEQVAEEQFRRCQEVAGHPEMVSV